jgi:hypothetical protein
VIHRNQQKSRNKIEKGSTIEQFFSVSPVDWQTRPTNRKIEKQNRKEKYSVRIMTVQQHIGRAVSKY